MSENKPQSIAFFDVDYTLVNCSTGYFTTLKLMEYGILKQRRFFQAAYYAIAYLFFNVDIKKIYQTAIVDLAGTTLDLVLKIGKECFERDIIQRIYPEGLEKIREHRERGDKIILLTAAPYMLIETMQQYLGVDEAHSMGPEIVGGILTNRLKLPVCHGPGKVHYAELMAQKYNIPLSQCYFYSDEHTDLPLLEKVGFPRPTNPNRKLRRVARQRGWPILDFGQIELRPAGKSVTG